MLGMRWTPMHDAFRFKLDLRLTDDEMKQKKVDEINYRWTPREVLSLLARIYDPLGLVAPSVVKGKILMRRTCSENNEMKDQKRKWVGLLPYCYIMNGRSFLMG